MIQRTLHRLRPLLVLPIGLAVSVLALAQDQVKRSELEPPGEVLSEIRDSLAEECFEVHLRGRLVARFWMRKELPLMKAPSDALGMNFSDIQPSAVVGVVQMEDTWNDYKGLPIPAGVYTLRYGLIPQDGNHMGVSVYRDFVQLVPAAEDRELKAEFDFDQLVALSSRSSGTPHPAVMALFPIWDEVPETSLVKNELDQWTLAWKCGDRIMGFVVEGHGE